MSPNYLLKIVTVGSGSVGKTSMIVRYSSGVFREHYSPTLGTGFAYKKMELEKDKVTLQIWDMGSQEFLERIRANYYIGTHGVIFVYDITSWDSMNDVIKWKEEVDRHLDDYRGILVGNKTDLAMDRLISTEEGQNMADQFKMAHIETSVRLNKNVTETFVFLTKDIIEWFFNK